MARITHLAMLVGAALLAGCNSILGFDVSGGQDAPNPPVTLIVSPTGEGSGVVRSQPSGILCPPNCSRDFPGETTVTLTMTPGPGSRAGEFGTPCLGISGPCELTLTTDFAIDARFDDVANGANFAFVTAEEYQPVGLTLASADAACAAEAAAAGLPPNHTYRAWLSTSTVDAKDRLGTARGWVRVDGLPIADTVDDLIAGEIFHPVHLTAAGEPAPLNGAGHTVVMTGTTSAGVLPAPFNCVDWTSASGMGRVGNANNTGRTWTDWFDGDCDVADHLYCLGVDRNAEVALTPITGRLAFVTSGSWTSGGGLASADAFCQAEAQAASRNGLFRALLATTTNSAVDRIDASGTPWVRADGMLLAAPGQSPFQTLQAPLNVHANGTYSLGDFVMTGADSPTQVATNANCNNWTVGTAGASYSFGISESINESFKIRGTNNPFLCNNAQRLYCFEQ